MRKLHNEEKAHRLTEDKYHAVFMSVAEGILIFDKKKKLIMDVNKFALELLNIMLPKNETGIVLPAELPNEFPREIFKKKRCDWIPERKHPDICIELKRVDIGARLSIITITDISEARAIENILLKDKNKLKKIVKRSKEELISLNEKLMIKLWQLEEYETQLKRSEERFKMLSNASHEALILVENGKILDVNRSFAEMTGYQKEETVGRSLTDIFPADLIEKNRVKRCWRKKKG